MTDDKAVEAARRELRRVPRLSGHFTDGELDQIIRAALAAADKVRAGGFDFEYIEGGDPGKGEVERAALVEALKNLADAVDEYWDNRFPNEDMWNKLQKPVDQARLALVRKGV